MKNKLYAFFSRARGIFVSSTLSFLFIIVFINVFQTVFGPENSIVGVIFAIMMSASMVRDMTGTPLKHLLIQALVLVVMGISASLVATLNPWAALPIHFLTLFFILYAFTYEYANHMYFPYILSYLFLIFISPVGMDQLPKRLLGLLVGAVCIILYQLFMGRNRVSNTAQSVLGGILDTADGTVTALLEGKEVPGELGQVRHSLCALSRSVYERRKRPLQVSDAGFCMIDAGRGLEHLLLTLRDHWETLAIQKPDWLTAVQQTLEHFAAFLRAESADLPVPEGSDFPPEGADPLADEVRKSLLYVRDCLIHMSDPAKRSHFRPTVQSLEVRLQAALDLSAVRVVYALRTALLLCAFTLACQLLALPHGKWLMFTLASLSLPYADDVGAKTRKRILATILGGLLSVALYTLLPSPAGRTAVMMLSGYCSMFLTDYTGTYACSTIGALGGAVFTSAFSLGEVGNMFLIRISYILLGAALAWFFNCVFFPFKRSTATQLLLKKYTSTTELLSQVCRSEQPDPQLYYHLVIQAHLQEDKLSQNAAAGGWAGDMEQALSTCRQAVRHAHRQTSNVPVLDW